MSLPPAQPAYILRGHASQIHSTVFIRKNSRLVTGDAEGWIVSWSLATKRPVAVWRAHVGTILGIDAWSEEKIITHGKDDKLIVWKLSAEDESSMSTVLPVDTPPSPRKQPWLLHVLPVNTMNFCSFARSECRSDSTSSAGDSASSGSTAQTEENENLLIAVPNLVTSETIDIFHLPSEKRLYTLPPNTLFKGGMIMAISLFYHHSTTNNNPLLTLLTGFESGHTSVCVLNPGTNKWITTYLSQPHTQPILSLAVPHEKGKDFYLTSSADATIGKHPIPLPSPASLTSIPPHTSTSNTHSPFPRPTPHQPETTPLKLHPSKHAGQQSLVIRNDNKIFATAGWDNRVRVYAVKSMRELAVLKWHKEGVYAVAFADVVEEQVDRAEGGKEGKDDIEDIEEAGVGKEGDNNKVLRKAEGTTTVKQQRLQKATSTHWLAAGSKDGKVSLWDIY